MPGFDDADRSDADILDQITEFLTKRKVLSKIDHRHLITWVFRQKNNGQRLAGILYLHRITDNRMSGTALAHLKILPSLCHNVVIVTTMWDLIDDRLACGREAELKEHFIKPSTAGGSLMARFHGTYESAWGAVDLLLSQAESPNNRVSDHTNANDLVIAYVEQILNQVV